jgi:hypothetical protein
MTTVINKDATKEDAIKIIKEVKRKISLKKTNVLKKHFGLSKLNIDAVEIQKEMRNEWE